MRTLALLVAASLVLGACTGDDGDDRRGSAELPAGSPSQSSSSSEPRTEYAYSQTELAVPTKPEAAAKFLAQAATSAPSPAALTEILTRSGIPIFRADTGELANSPARPTYIDSYIYDATVPMLASSLQAGPAISFETVASTLTTLGLRLGGKPVTARDVAALVEEWTRTARRNANAPAAFTGLMVGALQSENQDLQEAASDGPLMAMDQISFTLLLSSLVSGTGEIVSLAPQSYAGTSLNAAAPAETLCDEPAKKYDSGLEGKAKKDAAKETARAVLEKLFGKKFGKDAAKKAVQWGSRAFDAAKILGTLEARMAFLAGLKLTIEHDAPEGDNQPHMRHSVGDFSGNHWSYVAHAEFKSDVLLPILSCGPLAGLTIPEDGPVQNLHLQWQLSGGYADCLESAKAGAENCRKLERISSGAGGDKTTEKGESELKVETKIEPGCPNGAPGSEDRSRCNKGPVRTGQQVATVAVDLTKDPPVKLADFIHYKPNSPNVAAEVTEIVIKALAKILIDIGTDVASRSMAAKSTVPVYYHQLSDYRLRQSYKGVVFSATKCGGPEGRWTVKVSGNLGASIPAKASGQFLIDLDEDLEGTWRGSMRIDVTYKGFSSTSEADVTARVRFVEDSPTSARLVATNARVSGSAAYQGGGLALKQMFGGDGKSADFPLQVGRFCSESQQ